MGIKDQKVKSLYIHIPFCKKKCYYCDFPSFCGKDHLTEEYLKALKKEINLRASEFNIGTIFIGGGTPTFLNSKELYILGEAIEGLHLSEDYEFTVECNPGTLNRDKLMALKDIGVNRLSFGLQSTHDYHLKNIGRIHSYQEFVENYHLARDLGFNNINVDLIFGLPKETMEEWQEDLNRVCDLEPEHISCYSLIIEEDTPFKRLQDKGLLKLPSEELERDMYRMALEILDNKDYTQYEISNFSKPHKECKHNVVYWELKDYIACGTGAHSYVEGHRTKNAGTIEEYIDLMNNRGHAIIEEHINTKKDDIEEFIFMGMRMTHGISLKTFEERFNIPFRDLYNNVLLKFEHEKLIIVQNDRLVFTKKGVEFSNLVLADFLLDE
ncbi:MAG: radical SAM family heme chaperone HemW [Clostridiaceae bacterium]